jgi:hypothetical protein
MFIIVGYMLTQGDSRKNKGKVLKAAVEGGKEGKTE